jgi:hypothetical protein
VLTRVPKLLVNTAHFTNKSQNCQIKIEAGRANGRGLLANSVKVAPTKVKNPANAIIRHSFSKVAMMLPLTHFAHGES